MENNSQTTFFGYQNGREKDVETAENNSQTTFFGYQNGTSSFEKQ